MKVILRQDVENLGDMGEVVVVKDGYARNYLIPRQLAYVATTKAIRAIDIEKKQWEKRQEKEKSSAETIAAQLAELKISIAMKVGEEGRLFGSVTPQMIAGELDKLGYSIEKRFILIEEPIKSLGVFDVKVKLHKDVSTSIKIWVINEEE
jgi:large subunit ribosomal protein L9